VWRKEAQTTKKPSIFAAIERKEQGLKIIFDINGKTPDLTNGLLLLEIGLQGVALAVADGESHTLQRYVYAEGDNTDRQLVREVLAKYPGVNAKMQKTGISFRVPGVVFVPNSLYRFHEESMYLESTGISTAGQVLKSDKPAGLDFHSVYTIPRLLNGLVSREFFHHESFHSLTIAADDKEDRLEVDIRPTDFQVVLVQDGSPRLLNLYAYAEPMDILYRLLQVCQQFEMDQNQVNLHLSGFISENSTLYQQLYLHFGNIQFASSLTGDHQSEVFTDAPAYYFKSILNLAACVSSPVH